MLSLRAVKHEAAPVFDAETELDRLLATTRTLTEAEVQELAATNRELAADPKFHADCLKGQFVEDICRSMEETQVSQSELARRIGNTRQYVCRILDEDTRVNFTIETMTRVAMALGRRLYLRVLAEGESAHVFRREFREERTFAPMPTQVDTDRQPNVKWVFGYSDMPTSLRAAKVEEIRDECARLLAG